MYYILKNKTPVLCDSIETWAKAFDKDTRIVDRTKIKDYYISTVFLGMEHGYDENKKPILFETMVFGGKFDDEEYQTRYCTYSEAEEGHKKAVNMVKNIIKKKKGK